MDDITYSLIEFRSKDHDAVLQIQEQCKKYFFVPYEQLDRAIADGLILGAFHDNKVVGYVWSLVRDGFVRVRYLAVDPAVSGNGVGRGIVEELKRRYRNAYGIRLSCRIDYPAWQFWKKLGFTAARDRPGKAKAGSTLTDFHLELSPCSLFGGQEAERRTKVALDANVFFDVNQNERPHHNESIGLLADWLSAEIELCVTVAIYEDMNRTNKQGEEAPIDSWTLVEAAPLSFKCIHEQVCDILGAGQSPQDVSDRNHLSHAIAENVTAFITRDTFILDHADAIHERFGVNIQRPSEFVLSLDTVLNQDRYHRSDVESVGISVGRISDSELINSLQAFRRGDERESKLRASIRAWIANPKEWEVRAVTTALGVEAIFAIHRHGGVAEIPFYRCNNSIRDRRRGRTLMRYVASTLSADLRGPTVISVTDESGIADHWESLAEVGFTPADGAYHKVHLPGVWEPADAAAQIVAMNGLSDALKGELESGFHDVTSADDFLELERRICPGKLRSDDKVACLVVPIRPHWARALFDAELGERGLWDEDADLLFNPTSVYYTGARISANHARLLWYVSESDRFGGTQRIRACSQLRRTVVDLPLPLYRQFRHYGVYSLADVESTASEKRPKVMAMEFSNTEPFAAPVRLEEVRHIQNDEKQAFRWPTPITESEFFAIYERGSSDAASLNTP